MAVRVTYAGIVMEVVPERVRMKSFATRTTVVVWLEPNCKQDLALQAIHAMDAKSMMDHGAPLQGGAAVVVQSPWSRKVVYSGNEATLRPLPGRDGLAGWAFDQAESRVSEKVVELEQKTESKADDAVPEPSQNVDVIIHNGKAGVFVNGMRVVFESLVIRATPDGCKLDVTLTDGINVEVQH
jgi:hypothetical protein